MEEAVWGRNIEILNGSGTILMHSESKHFTDVDDSRRAGNPCHRPPKRLLKNSTYLRRRLLPHLCVAKYSTNHRFACDFAP